MEEKRLRQYEEALSQWSTPLHAKDRPSFIKQLLYGEYKLGKTTLASQCGKAPHLLAVDNGWTTLKDWPELAERVVVDEIQSHKHFDVFVRYMLEGGPLYADRDHIIIDPFNKLVDGYLDWLQDNAQPDSADARVTWTRKAGGPDPDYKPFTTPGMGDYRAARDFFRKLIYPLIKLPRHVTFICHVREPSFIDKGKGVVDVRASVPQKIHELIAQEVDLLSYMYVDPSGTRKISFKSTGKEDAGSRFRRLHNQIILADDLPKLYEQGANE